MDLSIIINLLVSPYFSCLTDSGSPIEDGDNDQASGKLSPFLITFLCQVKRGKESEGEERNLWAIIPDLIT